MNVGNNICPWKHVCVHLTVHCLVAWTWHLQIEHPFPINQQQLLLNDDVIVEIGTIQ